MNSGSITPDSILQFWFTSSVIKHWFKSTPEFDREIRSKFENVWCQASLNQFDHWKSTPEGVLALIIVLDQFPLNMYRGTTKSFSTVNKAIELAHYAISNGFDLKLPLNKVAFLYMPLMHSENLDDQNLSVRLFEKAGLESNLRYAKHHRDIIKKFQRFPHRNKILDRTSTVDELKYLASPQAFKG